MAAIANVASACHFKTYRIGLVESGGSIARNRPAREPRWRVSKLADFNCFLGLPAMQRDVAHQGTLSQVKVRGSDPASPAGERGDDHDRRACGQRGREIARE